MTILVVALHHIRMIHLTAGLTLFHI